MVTRVSLVLKRMEKPGSDCAHIISSLKKIFGKHFKVFEKFIYTADEFINICACILLCVYACIYACFMCVFYVCFLCLYVHMLQSIFVYK